MYCMIASSASKTNGRLRLSDWQFQTFPVSVKAVKHHEAVSPVFPVQNLYVGLTLSGPPELRS